MDSKMLRRMVGYFLGFAQSVAQIYGKSGLEAVVRKMAERSGQEKAEDLKNTPQGSRCRALAERFANMLEEMGGVNHRVVVQLDSVTVDNPDCPCPYPTHAKEFGFTPEEVVHYSCLLCMEGYTQAANALGVPTQKELFSGGCKITFGPTGKPTM